MNKRTKAIILLIITGLLWSLGAILIKTSDTNLMAISSIRGLVAGTVFACALKFKPKFTFSKPQISGALCYGVVLTTAVLANGLTSAANATLLQYMSPIWVAIIAYFTLHEKIKWFDFVSIAAMLVGLWLLVGNGYEGNSAFGDVCAIIAGICYGAFSVCLVMQKGSSSYETVLLGNIVTFLIGLPWLIMHPPTLAALPQLIFLGAFQIGVPYLLFTIASKNAKAIDLPIFTITEPLMSPVWVFIGTGEFPGIRAVFGGLLLLAVVIFKSIFSIREANKGPK
jgi:drug/metabolite transporter (DMT)-like permease